MKRLEPDILPHLFLSLAVLILAACNANAPQAGQVASSSGIHVWLDQPPDQAGLPLEAYTLRAHARDSTGGGVQQVTFLVNEIPLGSVPTDASQPLVSAEFNWNPSAPGRYTVQAQATGSSGTASSEIAVICVGPSCVEGGTPPATVGPAKTGCSGAPVIASFSASSASIAPGGSSTLSWSVSNADIIQMTGVGDVPATGTLAVSPGATTTYTLAALCGSKENMTVQTVTISVSATGAKGCSGKPVISAFTASPSPVTVGASSTLQWAVTNADRVEIAGIGQVDLTGSQAVSPKATTTYNLVAFCGGKENLAEQSATVTVGAAKPPPSRTPTKTPTATPKPVVPQVPQTGCTGTPNIPSFTANPSTISAGGSSTLNWGAVSNADSVSIDPGIGGVGTPGSVAVSPGDTTTYTLTARCGSNSVTRQATVTVQAAQPPPPPVDKEGPAISGVGWSEKTVYYNGSGCGPSSFTVSANVTDPSGVKFAQVTYRYLPSKGGASNPNGLAMNPSGGDSYSATIEVSKEGYAALMGDSGQVEFWVVAQDGVGNNSQSGTTTVSIQNCPP